MLKHLAYYVFIFQNSYVFIILIKVNAHLHFFLKFFHKFYKYYFFRE
jgi:hypothetical protein